MKRLKKFLFASILGLILLVVLVLYIESVFKTETKPYIYSEISELPNTETVIILGASVHSDGKLSPILKDRMDTAIKLFKNNKVKRFLVTGDHRTDNYNEVAAMVNYLEENGIEKSKIKKDHAGLDTYDSMYRAGRVFNIKDAVVVTQEFHLPRAVFIARKLDMDYKGFVAKGSKYTTENKLRHREKLANVKALWEVWMNRKPSSMQARRQ
ncbi:ElyC/SanA/YdcF family protein [Gramella sp. AN32]|uniref:Vancomycin high temperature exclusion protein n=1 Tax=Christiangramia antarctica TaxID=2058158 RepID=A0ABW5X238_9FLAO|nr:ElyC/SanA/YdcF family protein [Gramella sp. AN32]MCM4155667.1 hypothetical protein [Gramella sp. AN32]